MRAEVTIGVAARMDKGLLDVVSSLIKYIIDKLEIESQVTFVMMSGQATLPMAEGEGAYPG